MKRDKDINNIVDFNIDGEVKEREEEVHRFIVEEGDIDKRIDLYLVEKLDGLSRSYLKKIIDEDLLRVNNKAVKPSYKVKKDDEVEISIFDNEEIIANKENIKINILYEDDHIVVINKDQGMVVHPGIGNTRGTLVNGLLYHIDRLSDINGPLRPGIVHRIDKDTSGILVVAKTNEAHIGLAEQLKSHSMKRSYYALVEGKFKKREGTIESYLGRDPKDRMKYAVKEEGKWAVTHYKVIASYMATSLLKVNLETGRTHQIRVHMSNLGHPLLGDPLYGPKAKKDKRAGENKGQVLHAGYLAFKHPITGKNMEFKALPPKEFIDLIRKLNRNRLVMEKGNLK